ncbi:MAG: Ku protein [Chitinophagales bacterium]
MHAAFSGTIGLGGLAIPVKLYSAREEKEFHFTTVCRTCRTPVQLKKWCPTCQAELGKGQVARAIRQGDEYLLLPGEEGAKGEAGPASAGDEESARGRVITVTAFVRLAELDPLYFERPYYLEPAGGGARLFRLLKRALEAEGRAALGTGTLRNREVPVVIRPYGKTLVLHTLVWPEELRPLTALQTGAGRVGPRDLALAQALVQAGAAPFSPKTLRAADRGEPGRRLAAAAEALAKRG